MATKVIIPIENPDGSGGSMALYLQGDFDATMEKIFPTQQPSSALEHRANAIHVDAETGNRIAIMPGIAHIVMEDHDPE